MDKKQSIIFIIIIISVAMIAPIIINGLMFIRVLPVAGDEFAWIDPLSNLWGAIIGGAVSGALTLFGVKLSIDASFKGIEKTLDHHSNEKLKENIGEKLNKLYKVKNIVYKVDRLLSNRSNGWNEQYEKASIKEIESAILLFLLPELNPLLELSSAVDWAFYDEIKQYVDKARNYLYEGENIDYENLTLITDALTEKIEMVHEKRLSDEFKEASSH